MKSKFVIGLGLFILSCFAISVQAQNGVIPIAECAATRNKSENDLQRVIYRRTYFSEKTTAAGTSFRFKKIEERIPPDKSRIVEETAESDGINREETVWVGATMYVKKDNLPWQKFVGGGGGSGSGGGAWTGSVVLTKNAVIDGTTVDRYEVDTTSYRFMKNNRPVAGARKRTFWIDSKGRLLKEVIEDSSPELDTVLRTTDKIEYGVRIRIKPPIK